MSPELENLLIHNTLDEIIDAYTGEVRELTIWYAKISEPAARIMREALALKRNLPE